METSANAPSLPGRVLDSIPFRHAGKKAEGIASPEQIAEAAQAKAEVHVKQQISIDGASYHIYHGFLIPFYDHPTDPAKLREERIRQIKARVDRFFDAAESDLRVDWNDPDKIRQAQKEYEELSEQDPRRESQGRVLVGAMMRRMRTLSQDIFNPQGERNRNAPEYKEFIEWYHFLVLHEEQSPVRYVHLRDPNPGGEKVDVDGVLFDLVRETGKPVSAPETIRDDNILNKIGHAMAAIDATRELMQRLAEQRPVADALANIADRGYAHLMPYADVLSEFTNLCRARVGLRREDFEDIRDVVTRIKFLQQQLKLWHDGIKGVANAQQQAGRINALGTPTALLEKCADLMRKMAILRYPCNGEMNADVTRADSQKSSFHLLEEAVDEWC